MGACAPYPCAFLRFENLLICWHRQLLRLVERILPVTSKTVSSLLPSDFYDSLAVPLKAVSRDAFFLNLIYLILINLFLPALGLRCCVQAFSSCGERGLLFVAVRGLLIAVASLVAERGI